MFFFVGVERNFAPCSDLVWEVRGCTGWIGLAQDKDRFVWIRWWTVGFYKMRGISRVAEDLFASQEDLCCMELVIVPTFRKKVLRPCSGRLKWFGRMLNWYGGKFPVEWLANHSCGGRTGGVVALYFTLETTWCGSYIWLVAIQNDRIWQRTFTPYLSCHQLSVHINETCSTPACQRAILVLSTSLLPQPLWIEVTIFIVCLEAARF